MSRLDRLVILLESGSTPFIRNTAADQLSDLAAGHPEDAINLLGRVYPFLKSGKWETRISAARAFGGIVNHCEKWDPDSPAAIKLEHELEEKNEPFIKTEEDDQAKIKEEQNDELKKIDQTLSTLVDFNSWNLHDILKSNQKLLACSTENYEDGQERNGGELDEDHNVLKKFKRVKTESTDSVDDVKMENSIKYEDPGTNVVISPKTEERNIEQDAPTAQPSGPANARLKAMERRRAKANAKSGSSKPKAVDLSQSSLSRKLAENEEEKTENKDDVSASLSQQGIDKVLKGLNTEELSPLLAQKDKASGLVWQFQGVYELLVADLFDDKWEIRHGAALGLRELVKKHAKSAGRIMYRPKEENDRNNAATLEDLAVRLCTLFALDRFGDFVSDTVVAPVRESCAQALAALLIHLDDDIILKIFGCLRDLILQNDNDYPEIPKCWEARHGGMLGLRYFVSVRTDVLLSRPEMLNSVFDMVLRGLREPDDDVQAVAASTLTPIAGEFIRTKKDLIRTLLSVIWDCLGNLTDDLSASIGLVMDLLAKICTFKLITEAMQVDAKENPANSFENLIPKLFPFFRHSIINVRKAVLRTLLEFLSIKDKSTKKWITGKALRLVFQNLLVEQNQEVLQLSGEVFDRMIVETFENDEIDSTDNLFGNNYSALLTLLMTPIGISRHHYHMNTNLIIRSSGHTVGAVADAYDDDEPMSAPEELSNEARGQKRKSHNERKTPEIPLQDEKLKVNIDAPIYRGDVLLVSYETFVSSRCAAAKAYGKAMSYVKDEGLLNEIFKSLLKQLKSPHATPCLFGAMVIQEYATTLLLRGISIPDNAVSTFYDSLMNIVLGPDSLPFFRELVPMLKSVRTSCLQLLDAFLSHGMLLPTKIPDVPIVVQGEVDAGPGAFSLESAEKIVGETYDRLMKALSATYRLSANRILEDSKHRVEVAISELKATLTTRSTSIFSVCSGAILALGGVPKKLNPIIRSLMDSVKLEEIAVLREKFAKTVADLVKQLVDANKKSVVDKIVKNLSTFLCVDAAEVPEFVHNSFIKDNILSLRKEEARTDPKDIVSHEKAVNEARIKRAGGLKSLSYLFDIYKSSLFAQVPKIKEIIIDNLGKIKELSADDLIKEPIVGQSIIDSLGILRAVFPMLDPSLYGEITEKLSLLLHALRSELSVIRYSTAKCLATITAVYPAKTIPFFVKNVIPMLSNPGNLKERQGAVECIYHISAAMGGEILPYIVFLIVPVLGRMSDPDEDIRKLSATTFASIIKLVPLEAGIPDPPDMPAELLSGREREREFIQQMMDPSKIKPFELPVSIKASLRSYQQEGVNWLAFLNKYHLHGILCDDMGLGKTLQTICIIASDHHMREEKFKEEQELEYRALPSIIIGPPSLVGHWEQEFNQYAPFLKVLVYAGSPTVRSSLTHKLFQADIIVTSYDVCRNDIELIANRDYNYCVLDEGHVIKNSSSKLTKSVKQVKAEHRLILSGTPIQNNVLELWSLFDFLMPGFLGTEKLFQEKFARPIAASRNSKNSSKEQEAGALALESLHRQVLPFMLRRLKEDVLSDLPPKIIQDYYCHLSELQKKLYKDFVNKQRTVILEDIQQAEAEQSKNNNIFQALQYMRKLCNHPALIMGPEHPRYLEVSKYLLEHHSDLNSIEHSPKLNSLRTLLLECGIGANEWDYSKASSKRGLLLSAEGVISQHRSLIFCQLKDMLDIVENELLKKHMPSVTYIRLDGSTDPRERQSIVRKFNEDPSIDVLLLTTKVGGLGLNLTGADTVIFVEHDWNPMNDLQAMDRAHRLGQKKVVNVYRLVTKDTLEEKIMGLQKFKMNVASTIINQQNSGLSSMDTNQLLDLFEVSENDNSSTDQVENNENNDKQVSNEISGGLSGKAAGAVGELSELWDESQYDDEYNLDKFIKTLK